MFDHYRPATGFQCPLCGESNLEWQGKDGPCALFVWEQGGAAPIEQRVPEESRISIEDLAEVRLPARFEIYAKCKCPTFLAAVGVTEGGVWTKTELLSSTNAVAYSNENERDFKKRLTALSEHPGHI